MEKLLKKDDTYCCNGDCEKILDVLKEKMASTPILVFPKWDIEFHVHIDALCIALGVVLTQGAEGVDHPITFVSRWLSKAEKNYSTAERGGLAMIYHSRSTNTIYLMGTSRCILIIPR